MESRTTTDPAAIHRQIMEYTRRHVDALMRGDRDTAWAIVERVLAMEQTPGYLRYKNHLRLHRQTT